MTDKDYILAAIDAAILNKARIFRMVGEGVARDNRDIELQLTVEETKTMLEGFRKIIEGMGN